MGQRRIDSDTVRQTDQGCKVLINKSERKTHLPSVLGEVAMTMNLYVLSEYENEAMVIGVSLL